MIALALGIPLVPPPILALRRRRALRRFGLMAVAVVLLGWQLW
jgi:hypothetical protein